MNHGSKLLGTCWNTSCVIIRHPHGHRFPFQYRSWTLPIRSLSVFNRKAKQPGTGWEPDDKGTSCYMARECFPPFLRVKSDIMPAKNDFQRNEIERHWLHANVAPKFLIDTCGQTTTLRQPRHRLRLRLGSRFRCRLRSRPRLRSRSRSRPRPVAIYRANWPRANSKTINRRSTCHANDAKHAMVRVSSALIVLPPPLSSLLPLLLILNCCSSAAFSAARRER